MNHFLLGGICRSALPIGLYIHIPFCLRKCPYCDFYSITDFTFKTPFFKSLVREIRFYSKYALPVDSVYIGGGTPSIINPTELKMVLSEIRSSFDVRTDAEISLEVNPGTVTHQSLRDYRWCGINRISVGVQSFQNCNLDFLGRVHTAEEAIQCIEEARQSGFDNISLDLMYGLPAQTRASWLIDLEQAVSFNPEHLSCYMLSYENETPLWQDLRCSRFEPLSDERAAKLYLDTVQWLGKEGYAQYEVSNFEQSKSGNVGKYRSRHNQKYWSFAPYLGLGPSAHSYFEPVRFWNPRSVSHYVHSLNSGKLPTEDSEMLTREQQMMEMILLGLRTSDGIRIDRFSQKFKSSFLAQHAVLLAELRKEGLLNMGNGRCFLTAQGMLFLDSIVARLIAQP